MTESTCLEFRQATIYRGPNVWHRHPVIEQNVFASGLSRQHPSVIDGMIERYVGLLGPVIAHAQISGATTRIVERIIAAHSVLEVIALLALELQSIEGLETSFFHTQFDAGDAGRVIVEFEEEAVGHECLSIARRCTIAAIEGSSLEMSALLRKLRDLSEQVCLGPSTRAIYRAAQRRNIYVRRLNVESLVQLGQGSKQRRIRAAETDDTGAVAESIAGDKELTKSLLRAVGVPVPEGRAVESPEDAWEAACEIGQPVVVKPRDANHGRGVAINLTRREQIVKAYEVALEEGSGVLVERFTRGGEHRLLVVGDRVVAAARGEPETIIGDGQRTITELVEEANRDPRRGEDYADLLSVIKLDAIALVLLEQQGYTPESVPPAGRSVLIHYNGDLTTDETEEVHPEVTRHCVNAAKAVGLNIAGIDLIATEISQPLEPQGGAIVEVNAGPGLAQHIRPQHGKPQPVGDAIVATMFGPGQDGRIPVCLAMQSESSANAVRHIAKLLSRNQLAVGLANSEGMFVGERKIRGSNETSAESLRTLLLNPLVDAIVCEVAAEDVRLGGLGIDECQVALITKDESGRVAMSGSLASPEQVLVRAVRPDGAVVLNADDQALLMLASDCRGASVLYSRDAEARAVAYHRERHGKAVVVKNNAIVLADGSKETTLVSLDKHNSPIELSALHAWLPAIAVVWSLGISVELLRRALDADGVAA